MEKKSGQNRFCEKAIKNWPKDERPREKLLKSGEHTLSNTELLAILLRNGTRGQSAIDLARSVISEFKSLRNMSHTNPGQWKAIKGLGPAKIAQIRAALEIGRRFREVEAAEKKIKINCSKDAADLMMPRMRDLKTEVFKILLLDIKNYLIDIKEIEAGTVNQANPIIREIISSALQNFASALICAHNHPSGDYNPSREDKDFTRELCQAGKVMQVTIADHIIIGNNGYYSFADEGKLMK